MKSVVPNSLGLNKDIFSANFGRILYILLLSVLTVTPKFFVAKYLMVLWVLLLLFTFKDFKKADKRLSQIGSLGFLFIIVILLYYIFGISSASLAYSLPSPFVFFSPIIAMVIVDRSNNQSQCNFLFHFISLAIAINIADSIGITHEFGFENIVYQTLAETLGEEGIEGLNLGGSLFVNMSVFYASVMFMAFLNTKNRFEKILFLLYFGIGAYFIIICSLKASAITLLLLSVLLMYIAKKGKKSFGQIVFFSVFFIAIILVFRDQLINILIDIIGSDRVASRFEVFVTGANVTDSSTLMSREDLWQVSLHSWLRNPITFFFGIGDHNWKDFSTTAASGIGDHSDLLDVLARYGLVGGLILYTSLIELFKYLRTKHGYSFKWEIHSFFILIVLMGLTKKFVSGETAIVMFILFPLCLRYLSKDNTTCP